VQGPSKYLPPAALFLMGLLALTQNAGAQVSPGPLAQPHEHLEGATQCFRCHGSRHRDAGMNKQCMDCHGEIAWLVQRKLGLHGLEDLRDCQTCHPDHAGRDFELIMWDDDSPESFDHDRTGWSLTAAHARVECAACHRAEFQKADVVRLRKRSDPNRSWLGLVRDCSSCHKDPHAGSLGADCTQCHQRTVWTPAAGFDHARTAFPLDGKHVDLRCAECHRESLPTERLYSPLTHDDCSACHETPHRRELGASCASCHVTTGFKQVAPDKFNHAATQYPLIGRHAGVDCERCHDPQSAWGRRPAFATCTSCHRDAHGKQTKPDVDCSACHDERGFRPSSWRVADHDRTEYPLEGKHATVPCAKCHAKQTSARAVAKLGSAGIPLHPRHEKCSACHEAAHADQFADRADAGACRSCHVLAGWKPSTFTAERHSELEFALEGRHAEASCGDCHGPQRTDLPGLPDASVLGSARVALTTLDPACVSCHLDPHAAELTASCENCHSSSEFRPSRVDVAMHGKFDYPLDGAHRAVPCAECHAELTQPPSGIRLLEVVVSLRALRFEVADQRCSSCHDGPHESQFDHRADAGACESCHDVTAFRPATGFDHNRDATFALDGAHRAVACAACHPNRVYRPLPRACRDCHNDGSTRTSAGAGS